LPIGNLRVASSYLAWLERLLPRTSFIANYQLKTHKYSKKSGYYLHNPLKKSNFVRFFTKKTEHTKQEKDEK